MLLPDLARDEALDTDGSGLPAPSLAPSNVSPPLGSSSSVFNAALVVKLNTQAIVAILRRKAKHTNNCCYLSF